MSVSPSLWVDYVNLETWVPGLWKEAAAPGHVCVPLTVGRLATRWATAQADIFVWVPGLRSPPCATWISATFPWILRPVLWSWKAVSICIRNDRSLPSSLPVPF